MMANKVKLPREVAGALEKLGKRYSKDFILWHSSREDYPDAERDTWKTIHEFVYIPDAIFTLADALRYGYEVEPEPITVTITTEMQEKIAQYYANLDPGTQEDGFDREFVLGERSAVRFTLKMLGITIPGIPSEG